MRRKRAFIRPIIENEQGITLVEILLAVTIMSIISVTMMGYFVSATEKSADQSRRVIGANLARLKAAEIREIFRGAADDPASNYSKLWNEVSGGNPIVIANDSQIPASLQSLHHPQNAQKVFSVAPTSSINGTVYRYLLEFSPAEDIGSNEVKAYLVKMKVTVYWTADETTTPSARSSVAFDSYVRGKGGT